MPKRKNLIGQRFGLLTVVALTDQIENNYVVWRCKCDCGGEILVNTKHLMRHTITNCGCIPKTNAKRGSIAEDLTGQVFGDLTVLHRTESLKGRTRWVCQCSCGNQTTILLIFLGNVLAVWLHNIPLPTAAKRDLFFGTADVTAEMNWKYPRMAWSMDIFAAVAV